MNHNRIFAWSSAALLLVSFWAFWDDYDREWKHWQRDFRQLDYERAKEIYERAKDEFVKSGKQTELDALKRQLREEKERLNSGETKRLYGEATRRLKKVELKLYKVEQQFLFAKAECDADMYRYKRAHERGDEESAAKEKQNLDALRRRMFAYVYRLKIENVDRVYGVQFENATEESFVKRYDMRGVPDMDRIDEKRGPVFSFFFEPTSLSGTTNSADSLTSGQPRFNLGDEFEVTEAALSLWERFDDPLGESVLLGKKGRVVKVWRPLEQQIAHVQREKREAEQTIKELTNTGEIEVKIAALSRNLQRLKEIMEGKKPSFVHNYITNPPRIEQIVIESLDAVDRCQTCHLAIEKEGFEDAAQPFRTHPGELLKSHSIKRFGCTVCHQGQGRGTTVKTAHGHLEYWKKPMLDGKDEEGRKHNYVQASCGRCHKGEETKGAPVLTKAKMLAREIGCVGCHVIPIGGVNVEHIGPELSTVGSKDVNNDHHKDARDWQWFFDRFKDPRSVNPDSFMPKFGLTDEEATALTTMVLGFTDEKLPPEYLVPLPSKPLPPDIVERGRITFDEFGCAGCHGRKGRGGIENPNSQGKKIPGLHKLADTIVVDKEEADKLISLLQKGVELDETEKWLKQYHDIKKRVVQGKKPEVGQLKGEALLNAWDPDQDGKPDRPPLFMPSFQKHIQGKSLDYLVAYIIRLFPEEEWDKGDWDVDEDE